MAACRAGVGVRGIEAKKATIAAEGEAKEGVLRHGVDRARPDTVSEADKKMLLAQLAKSLGVHPSQLEIDAVKQGLVLKIKVKDLPAGSQAAADVAARAEHATGLVDERDFGAVGAGVQVEASGEEGREGGYDDQGEQVTPRLRRPPGDGDAR